MTIEPRTTFISDSISSVIQYATTPGELNRAIPFIHTLRDPPWCDLYWITADEDEYLDRVLRLWEIYDSETT